MGIIIGSCIVAFLVILKAVAAKFNSIAEEKGHSGYFWWCFLLGPAGWAMVIALPDRSSRMPDYTGQLQELKKLLGDIKSPNANAAAVEDDSLPEL